MIRSIASWLSGADPPGFDRFTENSQILTVKGNDTSFLGGARPSLSRPFKKIKINNDFETISPY